MDDLVHSINELTFQINQMNASLRKRNDIIGKSFKIMFVYDKVDVRSNVCFSCGYTQSEKFSGCPKCNSSNVE